MTNLFTTFCNVIARLHQRAKGDDYGGATDTAVIIAGLTAAAIALVLAVTTLVDSKIAELNL